MGYYFQAVDTNKMIKKFSLSNYVETGTGEGATLEYSMRHSFETFHSIEIHNEIYKLANEKFSKIARIYGRDCNIVHGNSYEELPEILDDLEGNTFFFLDAHFPGADFKFNNYGDTEDYDTRLPLEKEIEVIIQNRDISNDVFVIDDLVIFEPEGGPYEGGPLTLEKKICPQNGLEFIYETFSKTHDIRKSYKSQGFLILTPKQDDSRFMLVNNDGIPTWLEDFYNKFLPDSGFFVEVGVGHTIDREWSQSDTVESISSGRKTFPRCGSNTLDLLDYDFSGVYIDPVQEFCDEVSLIVKGKAAKIINLGCSDKEEILTLYGGETFLPNNHKTWPGSVDYIGRNVRCTTLSQILDENGYSGPIDLMSLDVEGWELKVLKGIRDEHLPKLMIVEIDKAAGVHETLSQRGYTRYCSDTRDAAYVKNDFLT